MSNEDVNAVVDKIKPLFERGNSPWCSRESAAHYMDCSSSKVDQLANEGKIKRYWCGKDPRFKKAELDAYLESNPIPQSRIERMMK